MTDHREWPARQQLWSDYDAALRRISARRPDSSLAVSGYRLGQLPAGLAAALGDQLRQAQTVPFRAPDNTPGFVSFDFSAEEQASFNASSHFCRIDSRLAWSLADMLDALGDEVARELACPWRVLNVRAWSTPPTSQPTLMYGWHTDGFVEQVYKVMVYLTPLSVAHGGIELEIGGERIVPSDAAPGHWLLFRNSSLVHRGVAGTQKTRLSVEITLCRAASFDLRPKFPGLNAHWPAYPFIDEVPGYRSRDEMPSVTCPLRLRRKPPPEPAPDTPLPPENAARAQEKARREEEKAARTKEKEEARRRKAEAKQAAEQAKAEKARKKADQGRKAEKERGGLASRLVKGLGRRSSAASRR